VAAAEVLIAAEHLRGTPGDAAARLNGLIDRDGDALDAALLTVQFDAQTWAVPAEFAPAPLEMFGREVEAVIEVDAEPLAQLAAFHTGQVKISYSEGGMDMVSYPHPGRTNRLPADVVSAAFGVIVAAPDLLSVIGRMRGGMHLVALKGGGLRIDNDDLSCVIATVDEEDR
jgi:hypothetical protein